MQHQDEVSFSSRQLLPTNATRATTASDNHYRIQHVGATMTKHRFLFSLIYIAYISSACAFSIPKNAQTTASKQQMSTTNLGVSSSTKKEDLSSMKAVATETSSSFVTEDVLDSELVDEIREELLHKYLAQGISRDSAIREIDSSLTMGLAFLILVVQAVRLNIMALLHITKRGRRTLLIILWAR